MWLDGWTQETVHLEMMFSLSCEETSFPGRPRCGGLRGSVFVSVWKRTRGKNLISWLSFQHNDSRNSFFSHPSFERREWERGIFSFIEH